MFLLGCVGCSASLSTHCPSGLEGLPALWDHWDLTSLRTPQSFAWLHGVSPLHRKSWISSQGLKEPLCRFLELFLCQAPNSLVFCLTYSSLFSLSQIWFLSPLLSEMAMITFRKFPSLHSVMENASWKKSSTFLSVFLHSRIIVLRWLLSRCLKKYLFPVF